MLLSQSQLANLRSIRTFNHSAIRTCVLVACNTLWYNVPYWRINVYTYGTTLSFSLRKVYSPITHPFLDMQMHISPIPCGWTQYQVDKVRLPYGRKVWRYRGLIGHRLNCVPCARTPRSDWFGHSLNPCPLSWLHNTMNIESLQVGHYLLKKRVYYSKKFWKMRKWITITGKWIMNLQ